MEAQATACTCEICKTIVSTGLTDLELIHYLATKSTTELGRARIEKARCDADVDILTMKIQTLGNVIRDRKSHVDATAPVRAETVGEAK